MDGRPPNILFVICDQMRSTAMGCAGVEAVQTPHFDTFAGQGSRFTNAIANSPTCAASRANLLTGLHTMRHGLVNNDMTLGTHFRGLGHRLTAAGYDCGWIGKWHLHGVNRGAPVPAGPHRQGFDHYWAGVECNHRYMAGYRFDETTHEPIWYEGYEPDRQTELAIDFLEGRADNETPFCLALSWGPPHCPYDQVPQAYKDLYDPATLALMPSAREATPEDWRPRQGVDTSEPLSPDVEEAKKRRIIANYYAQCSAIDACFGRLMAAVDRLGLAEDTLVIFTSDHGDMLFNHNRGWKGKPWRESVGIPFLARWPGHIPDGRVTGGPLGIVDLMPTLVSIAGGDVPTDVDGRDLSAFLLGDEAAAPSEQYISYPILPDYQSLAEWRGVVTATHTYACFRDGPWLLYDDQADPQQMTNLVDDPAAADILRDLADRTADWRRHTGDAFPSSRELADRLCPGHIDNVLPIPPLPDVILHAQQSRLAAWRESTH